MADDALVYTTDGLIPVVAQEAGTGEVLMVAWMNAEALSLTRKTGLAHYWSRSRGRLWQKGESSGHPQHVEALYADCDRDALLLLVHQEGVTCHTGSRTCFFQRVGGGEVPLTWAEGGGILDRIARTIQDRKAHPTPDSYVAALIATGAGKILKKIGEEAAEVIVAATSENEERLISELADLWFHTLVLLGARGIPYQKVLGELARRHAEKTSKLG